MWIDGNATAVVRNRQIAVCVEVDLNPVGMTSHCFVHGIVDNFGEQMVHRFGIGAANIHAWTATDGFQAFKNLNVGRRIFIISRFGW